MDVYVKRTYNHHTDHCSQSEVHYPFYDYRSRRQSTGSTLCPTQNEGNALSLSENSGMPQHLRPAQAPHSMLSLDPCRVTLHIITEARQAISLFDIYQGVIDCVNPKLKLFRITERENVFDDTSHETLQGNNKGYNIPAIAITIFLKATDQNINGNEEIGTNNRADMALQMFQRLPWRFHHSEQLTQANINVVSTNSQDFYYTSHDLPLWAVRHVHYGREHVRYVLYTSENSWPEQVHFYKLILGLEPDVLREDFCLFTMYTHDHFDIQLALKKLDSSVKIVTLDNVHIHVKVKGIGLLVPLFPNVCRPISDVTWQTTDHDGNVIVLDSSQGRSSASNNNDISHKTSNLEINTQHTYTSKERSVGKTKCYFSNNRHDNNMSFQAYELSTIPPASESFLHSQHLDTSSHSYDSEDFDIDLPSPPLRNVSKIEEDEESLCLTSTSEESGIQMHHGSEDSSFGEEETLRPCLSKNPVLKIRHVKFKVRFKEEVESFEDSFSRVSSGIESEGPSDTEMETSFRFNPSYLINSHSSTEGRSHTNLNNPHANDIRTNFESGSKCNSYKESDNFSRRVSAVDHRLSRDKSIQQCPPKFNFSSTGDIDDLIKFNHIQTRNIINRELEATSFNAFPASFHQQNHIKQQCQSSNLCTRTETSNEHGDKHDMVKRLGQDSGCDACQNSWYSNTQTFTGIQRTLSSNKTRIKSSSFRVQTNNEQINSQLSSNITLAKSNHERQHKNRSASVNIREKKESQLSPPSANDCRKQLISVEANPLDNKTLPDKGTKCNPFPQLQHIENGQKRFWFDEGNKDLVRNECSDLKDTTLKFTLKFDTCPTSGLSCKQEQVGFYV